MNCPAPIETVSPSPVTPSAIRFLFASIAPVATDGMRPCTELKAMRPVHEIGRALRRAADPAELRHALRFYSHFVHRIDDAFRNRVMSAAGAQRGLAAAIIDDLQSDAIRLRSRSRVGVLVGVVPIYLPSIIMSSSVTDRASIGKPWMWQIDRNRVISSGLISSFNRLAICPSRFCSTTYTRSCRSINSCTSRVNGYDSNRR